MRQCVNKIELKLNGRHNYLQYEHYMSQSIESVATTNRQKIGSINSMRLNHVQTFGKSNC